MALAASVLVGLDPYSIFKLITLLTFATDLFCNAVVSALMDERKFIDRLLNFLLSKLICLLVNILTFTAVNDQFDYCESNAHVTMYFVLS